MKRNLAMGNNLRLDLSNPAHLKLLRKQMSDEEIEILKKSDFQSPMVTDSRVTEVSSQASYSSANNTSDNRKGKGKSKYGNEKFTAEGTKWDSRWEYEAWLILGECQRRGMIYNLRRQRTFIFKHREIRLTSFRADYTFDLTPEDMSRVGELTCYHCGEVGTCFLKGDVPVVRCIDCGKSHLWDTRIPDVVADAKSEYVAGFAKFHTQQNMMKAFYNREILVLIKEHGAAGVEDAVKKIVLQFQNR